MGPNDYKKWGSCASAEKWCWLLQVAHRTGRAVVSIHKIHSPPPPSQSDPVKTTLHGLTADIMRVTTDIVRTWVRAVFLFLQKQAHEPPMSHKAGTILYGPKFV